METQAEPKIIIIINVIKRKKMQRKNVADLSNIRYTVSLLNMIKYKAYYYCLLKKSKQKKQIYENFNIDCSVNY